MGYCFDIQNCSQLLYIHYTFSKFPVNHVKRIFKFMMIKSNYSGSLQKGIIIMNIVPYA